MNTYRSHLFGAGARIRRAGLRLCPRPSRAAGGVRYRQRSRWRPQNRPPEPTATPETDAETHAGTAGAARPRGPLPIRFSSRGCAR
jgi:hypothetical protein